MGLTTEFGRGAGLSLPTRWLERHRQIKQTQLTYDIAVRDLEQQVIQAHLNSQRSQSAIAATQEQQSAATESLRLSSGRFEAGVGVILDVISAEAALSSARAALATAVMDFNRAQVALLEAIGQVSIATLLDGWMPATDTEKEPPPP